MATEATQHYCPMCGKPVNDDAFNRFGEWCCSEAHAEAYVGDVRKEKQQSVVTAEQPPVRRRGCC